VAEARTKILKSDGSIKADGNYFLMAVDNANDSEGNGEIAMEVEEEPTEKKSLAVLVY
jgi:hypothetical protein